MATRKNISATPTASATSYQHTEAQALIRPEAGAQTRFRKKKPTATYRYDSSLAPELQWDALAPAREQGEARIAELEAALAAMHATLAEVQSQLSSAQPGQAADELTALLHRARARIATLQNEPLRAGRDAVAALKALSRPFLNWAGKAERLSFDVPTLPLFIHERLSTQAILDSVSRHRLSTQLGLFDFFGHPERSLPEQLRLAYEHPNGWQNRMVLGDSLVVMNSLLHYENLGSSVQMIYIDPPYGVKFGSNFQPFVRKRDVTHNDDEGLTREPEMVKAYRDTWELGLHSYLTYLRDRLLLARELLTESGSVFVQISDENLHHVREVMDEVFGAGNFVSVIALRKTGGATSDTLPTVTDFLVWYSKSRNSLKYRPLFVPKALGEEGSVEYKNVELFDGLIRPITDAELNGVAPLPDGARIFATDSAVSEGFRTNTSVPFTWSGITFDPGKTKNWKTTIEGMLRLCEMGRIVPKQGFRIYKRYFDDFPFRSLNNVWNDLRGALDRLYVVQTAQQAIQRCLLMTTDPGDLVLDPTCGSGTTAYVAENWGRRWITIDTSRVPLALARQRLLTATFKYFELKEPSRGPAGGFVYREKKNRKGEHIGGIVPHITLGSIANNEPPKYEVLVDRPEEQNGVTRVCGPFVFEATIPTATNFQLSVVGCQLSEEGGTGNRQPTTDNGQQSSDFIDRMIEVLRASPVLHLAGGKTVQLSGIRRPAKTLFLSAEAMVSSWQLAVDGCQNEGARDEKGLSGPTGLAKGDGLGHGDLSNYPPVAEGGDVRFDKPDAQSRRVGAEQYFGGSGQADARGISTVSGAGKGIAGGTGNANPDMPQSGLVDRRCDPTFAESAQRNSTITQRLDPFTDVRALSVDGCRLSEMNTDNRQPTTAPVALLFGPENGAIAEVAVLSAWQEATAKNFSHLYVIGFAIEPKARQSIGEYSAMGMPTTYVQATPDILMGDLLKNMRSSQIFSVCGQPDVAVKAVPTPQDGIPGQAYYQAKLNGLDVFDPITMDIDTRSGLDVPAWFLDTDYNGMVFRVCQAFFPRTQAWDNLKRALKADFDESVWAHLAGDTSTPFNAGQHRQIAVKVIDDRGNELMVVKALEGKP